MTNLMQISALCDIMEGCFSHTAQKVQWAAAQTYKGDIDIHSVDFINCEDLNPNIPPSIHPSTYSSTLSYFTVSLFLFINLSAPSIKSPYPLVTWCVSQLFPSGFSRLQHCGVFWWTDDCTHCMDFTSQSIFVLCKQSVFKSSRQMGGSGF